MMARYVLEGMIETLLSKDKNITSLRENTEFMIIPFMDKDGVEDGDQGKARIPGRKFARSNCEAGSGVHEAPCSE